MRVSSLPSGRRKTRIGAVVGEDQIVEPDALQQNTLLDQGSVDDKRAVLGVAYVEIDAAKGARDECLPAQASAGRRLYCTQTLAIGRDRSIAAGRVTQSGQSPTARNVWARSQRATVGASRRNMDEA